MCCCRKAVHSVSAATRPALLYYRRWLSRIPLMMSSYISQLGLTLSLSFIIRMLGHVAVQSLMIVLNYSHVWLRNGKWSMLCIKTLFSTQHSVSDNSNLQVWSEKQAEGQIMIHDCDPNVRLSRFTITRVTWSWFMAHCDDNSAWRELTLFY